MRKGTRTLALAMLGLAGLLLAAGTALAQQVERVGDYRIHYSAVSTLFLTPEIVAAYDIERSKHTGLLNVSVLKAEPDGTIRPVPVDVEGRVGNLSGDSRPLAFRTIREADARSQLAVFPIQPGEPMRFNLEVRYDRDKAPAQVAFIQRFFID